MSDLKKAAAKAKKAGYLPGNEIELMLDRQVSGEHPELKEELGSDYRAFLISRTSETLDLMVELIHQGMPAQEARHQAIREMMLELEEPEDDPETIPPETGDIPQEILSAED